MTKPRLTPLGAVGRGLLAAAIGTCDGPAVVLALQAGRRREQLCGLGVLGWAGRLGQSLCAWQDRTATVRGLSPASTGRPIRGAHQQSQALELSYGAGWGALFGIVVGSANQPRARFGLVFGPLVFGTSYVLMPLAQLYKPLWEYDATTLWKDFSAHLLYGVVTAAAFRWLSKP